MDMLNENLRIGTTSIAFDDFKLLFPSPWVTGMLGFISIPSGTFSHNNPLSSLWLARGPRTPTLAGRSPKVKALQTWSKCQKLTPISPKVCSPLRRVCVCVCLWVSQCFTRVAVRTRTRRSLARTCVGLGLSLDGEERMNKFRNSKQTATQLKSNKKSVDWQYAVDGVKVKRETQTLRQRKRGVGVRGGGGVGGGGGGSASWNLRFLDPVFPAFGHSVAGKKCAVYLKCWITWQRQGLWIKVHNDFRRRERASEREGVCWWKRKRERERDGKRRGRRNATGWAQTLLRERLLTDKLNNYTSSAHFSTDLQTTLLCGVSFFDPPLPGLVSLLFSLTFLIS